MGVFLSEFRNQLESYLKELDIKANRILDIGGGANPVKSRVKSWKVKHYEIWDSKLEQPKAKVKEFDLDDLYSFDDKELEKFDIVFCLEVFEYIICPQIAMENICALTKEKAYITFPFVYPYHQPVQNDYLRYTQRGVEKLLEGTGFKTWKITKRIDKSNLLQAFYQSDGMHPAKGFQHDTTGFIVEAEK